MSVGDSAIDVRAKSAPISEVLDALAKRTGMKVVYEGAPPRQSVTASLQRGSAAEIILALMEGQDLNYGLKMDPAGQRVETLIVSGGGAAGAASPAAASAVPAPPRFDPPQPSYNEEEAFEAEEVPPPPQPEAQSPPGAYFPAQPAGVGYGSPFSPQPTQSVTPTQLTPAPPQPEHEQEQKEPPEL